MGLFDDDSLDEELGFPTYAKDFKRALQYNLDGMPTDEDMEDQPRFSEQIRDVEQERVERINGGQEGLQEDNMFLGRMQGRGDQRYNAENLFSDLTKQGKQGKSPLEKIFKL